MSRKAAAVDGVDRQSTGVRCWLLVLGSKCEALTSKLEQTSSTLQHPGTSC